VLPGEVYRAAEARLSPGDTLLVFSDGLAETRAGDSARDALTALGAAPLTSAAEVISRLLAPLRDDPAEDDVTVLVLHREA
jgi:serine phosphatase RsbU (regulator of sigma subunit)